MTLARTIVGTVVIAFGLVYLYNYWWVIPRWIIDKKPDQLHRLFVPLIDIAIGSIILFYKRKR